MILPRPSPHHAAHTSVHTHSSCTTNPAPAGSTGVTVGVPLRILFCAMLIALSMSAPAIALAASQSGRDPADPPAPPAPASVPAARIRDDHRPGRNTAPSPWGAGIAEFNDHRRSAVVSAWLTNGLRVHHRQMPQPQGQAFVVIAVSGGELLETADNRGISLLAAAALDNFNALDPARAAELNLKNRDVHLECASGPDSIQLTLWGSVDDLSFGLRAVVDMLLGPVIDDHAFEVARDSVLAAIDRRAMDERARVSDAVVAMLYPQGEVRAAPASAAQIRQITRASLVAWLDSHLRADGRPIEAAIVGDLSLEAALRLADAHLARLPARPRPAFALAAAERRIARPPGPIDRKITVSRPDGLGAAMVGCFGPDLDHLEEQRALRAAARILTARLPDALTAAGITRPQRAEPPGVGVIASAYPGFGLFIAGADVEPADVDGAWRVLLTELDRLVAQGPGVDELKPVAELLAGLVEKYNQDARYWASVLSRSTTLGVDPDVAFDGAAFYRALTPDRIRAALQTYCTPATRISVSLTPAPSQPPPAQPPQPVHDDAPDAEAPDRR